MKKIRIFCVVILFALWPAFLHNQDFIPSASASAQNLSDQINDLESEATEDEDYFYYDPENFSRKLFQKKLPPLDKHDKIIWSFRLARQKLIL